ncbi:MAG: beta/gamma crystallin-related protein [Xenococcaceae cyanobacterium]
MTNFTNNLNEQLFQELNDDIAANLSGGAAYLYANDTFTGRKLTYYKGTDNLGLYGYDFNDQTSSIKISAGETWEFYTDDRYGGKKVTLGAGSYTRKEMEAKGLPNESLTSLKISPN